MYSRNHLIVGIIKMSKTCKCKIWTKHRHLARVSQDKPTQYGGSLTLGNSAIIKDSQSYKVMIVELSARLSKTELHPVSREHLMQKFAESLGILPSIGQYLIWVASQLWGSMYFYNTSSFECIVKFVTTLAMVLVQILSKHQLQCFEKFCPTVSYKPWAKPVKSPKLRFHGIMGGAKAGIVGASYLTPHNLKAESPHNSALSARLPKLETAGVLSYGCASKMLAYLALRAPAMQTLATLPSFDCRIAETTELPHPVVRKLPLITKQSLAITKYLSFLLSNLGVLIKNFRDDFGKVAKVVKLLDSPRLYRDLTYTGT